MRFSHENTGPIANSLGSHLSGRLDLPELRGEFMPGAADLARIALSLADESPSMQSNVPADPELFLVAGNALHDQALEIVRRLQALESSGFTAADPA